MSILLSHWVLGFVWHPVKLPWKRTNLKLNHYFLCLLPAYTMEYILHWCLEVWPVLILQYFDSEYLFLRHRISVLIIILARVCLRIYIKCKCKCISMFSYLQILIWYVYFYSSICTMSICRRVNVKLYFIHFEQAKKVYKVKNIYF